jgi:hypothetical protein
MNVNLMKLLEFDSLFVDFFNSMSMYVDAVGRIAATIVGIVVFLYIAGKTWTTYARNEPLDIFPFFRPIIIFILCVNFQSIVVIPIHYTLSPLRTYTNGLAEKLSTNSAAKVDEIIGTAQEQRKQAIRDGEEEYGVFSKIGKAISLGLENLKEWLMSTILSICSLFKVAVYIIMNFIRIFCLVLLAMLGPFAFALSLLPTFDNGVGNWFAKYISIYLWAPIFNIIGILLDMAELFLAERVVSVAGSTGIWGLMVLLIVIYIIGAFVFLSTPTFATWIVQNGANASEMGTMMKGAGIAGAFAASAGGMGGGIAAKGGAGGATAAGGVIGAVAGAASSQGARFSGALSGVKKGASVANSLMKGKFGDAWNKFRK